MAVVTMRQLLESGVHFGHQTRRWNPKMKRFIMTERNGIYIIDLQQSLAYIDRSYAFVKETVAKGGVVMFVGTKKQAQEAIAEQATRVGMPYVNQRWLGGMLTNFQTVHQRINRLKELDEIDFDDVAGSGRTKKELLQMKRERDKLDKTLGGIREMSKVPSAVWIVDTNKEHLAVEEARKLRIPIIGILDSNCDPDLVDFPIPGNDDAIRAVGLLTRVVADAVAEGLIVPLGCQDRRHRRRPPPSRWPSGSASSSPVTPRRRPSRPPVATPRPTTPRPPRPPVPRPRRPPPTPLPRPRPTSSRRRQPTEAKTEAKADEKAETEAKTEAKRPTRRPTPPTAPTPPPRSRTARPPRASRSRATRAPRSSTRPPAPGTTAPTPRCGSAPPRPPRPPVSSTPRRRTDLLPAHHPPFYFEEEGTWRTSPPLTSRSSASSPAPA